MNKASIGIKENLSQGAKSMIPVNVITDALSTYQAANNKLVAARESILQFVQQNAASDLLNQATDEQIAQATGGLTRAQIQTSEAFLAQALAFAGPGELTVLYSCVSTVPQVS